MSVSPWYFASGAGLAPVKGNRPRGYRLSTPEGESGEGLSFRLGPDPGEDDSAEGHDQRDRGEGRDDAAGRSVQGTEQYGAEDRGDLTHSLRHPESRRPILGGEELTRVWVHSPPRAQVEEAHQREADEQRPERRGRREEVSAHAAQDEEDGQGPFPSPRLDEEHGDEVSRKLRDGGHDEERGEEPDVQSDDREDGERERKGEKQSVVTEVQGDPHHDRDGGSS